GSGGSQASVAYSHRTTTPRYSVTTSTAEKSMAANRPRPWSPERRTVVRRGARGRLSAALVKESFRRAASSADVPLLAAAKPYGAGGGAPSGEGAGSDSSRTSV